MDPLPLMLDPELPYEPVPLAVDPPAVVPLVDPEPLVVPAVLPDPLVPVVPAPVVEPLALPEPPMRAFVSTHCPDAEPDDALPDMVPPVDPVVLPEPDVVPAVDPAVVPDVPVEPPLIDPELPLI